MCGIAGLFDPALVDARQALEAQARANYAKAPVPELPVDSFHNTFDVTFHPP